MTKLVDILPLLPRTQWIEISHKEHGNVLVKGQINEISSNPEECEVLRRYATHYISGITPFKLMDVLGIAIEVE